MWYWILFGFGVWVVCVTIILAFVKGASKLSQPNRKE